MHRVLSPVLALLLLGSLCRPAAAQERKVVLQLCWDHQFQFAGYYAALWRGYYKDAGLDVEIRPALLPGMRFLQPPREVAEGRADFGVGEANILVAIDQGAPLVILASIFQHSGVEVYARSESNLVSVAQLRDMRIMRRKGDLGEAQLLAVLKAEGLKPSDFTFVSLNKDKPSARCLKDGDIEAILGFNLSTPYLLDKAGVQWTRLRPSMYGVDFYGDSLFTSRKLLRQDPDMVQRFVDASIKGWKYALTHQAEIIGGIVDFFPERIFPPKDDLLTFNRYQAREVMRLCDVNYQEVGHINPERWHQMNNYLRDTNVVENDLDMQSVLYIPKVWKELADQRFHRNLLIVIVAAVGLGSLAVFWGASMRRLVRLRTRELVAINERLTNEVVERTRIQEELRLSEMSYRTIFESTATPLILVGEDGTVLKANNQFGRLVGCTRAEIEGKRRWFDFFLGEFASIVRETHRRMRLGLGGVYRGMEVEMVDRQGDIRHIHLSTALVPGTTQGLASHLDITGRRMAEEALRRSEKLYRTITENFPGGILLLDAESRIIAANDTMRRWFQDVEFDRSILCFHLMGRDSICPDCPCREALEHSETRTAVKEMEVQGRSRVFKLIVCPISMGRNAPGQVMVIYTDITEEVRVNERMQQLSRTDLVATMGSGIAHEVNQPLNALKLWVTGLAMLLERDGAVAPELMGKQLGKIRMAADRIADVVNHMRKLIRQDDEAHVEAVDLDETVNRALGLMRAKLAHHGVSLELRLCGESPWIMANPIQLEQVIINLVANAVDAHDTHDRRDKLVEISTTVDMDVARLLVEDNGPGFRGNEERIFDPFFTTKEVGEGMGLGLSLVQAFVASWGGGMRAYVSRGHGGAAMDVELRKARETMSGGDAGGPKHDRKGS